jgi:hypothetical protein
MTALPPSCVYSLETWEPQTPGTRWACKRIVQALLYLLIGTQVTNSVTIYLVSKVEMSEGYEIHDKYWKSTNHCCRFQKACTAYGVPDVDLFQTVDLWDRKNIAQVTMTIFAIGRTVSSIVFRNNHILIAVSVMGIIVCFFTTCITYVYVFNVLRF